MNLIDAEIDWRGWFYRWEAMQNSYVPQRLARFDLILGLTDAPPKAEIRILDLGCGPGSLSLRALEYYPRARIVAVDFDPILLAMGRHAAGKTTNRIDFVQNDIRRAEFWQTYVEAFDLVISATALHWLSAEHLAQVYRQSYRALKKGGWLANSDHVASDNPDQQIEYRKSLQAGRDSAFRASGAEKWTPFWQNLHQQLARSDISSLPDARDYWEGSDDGQPESVHRQALQQCGFQDMGLLWHEAGEAIVAARKPAHS